MEGNLIYQRYDELEKTYWWHLARKKILSRLVERYYKAFNGNILDIGCGPGNNLRLWDGFGKAYGLDNSLDAVRIAKDKTGPRVVAGNALALPYRDGAFNMVVALDVLEHLDEPRLCLEEVERVCIPGGIVVLTVPAYQFLYHPYADKAGGHKMRYTRKALKQIVSTQGFRIVKLTYLNTFLFPLMVFQRLFAKIYSGGDKDVIDVMCPSIPGILNSLLKVIFSSEIYLLEFIDFPFGGSVLCICEKI